MQPIKSEYIRFNPFTKEYIYDVCTIISENGDRCKIEVQEYYLNSYPTMVTKNVKKTSVRYYIDLEKEENVRKFRHGGNYFD